MHTLVVWTGVRVSDNYNIYDTDRNILIKYIRGFNNKSFL